MHKTQLSKPWLEHEATAQTSAILVALPPLCEPKQLLHQVQNKLGTRSSFDFILGPSAFPHSELAQKLVPTAILGVESLDCSCREPLGFKKDHTVL